ncbi:MAG TPA: hypothetical protein VFA20_28715 [Myxococcaceae bacterium]|nr:hypothetical protein [Myxococcaceae bacterium]
MIGPTFALALALFSAGPAAPTTAPPEDVTLAAPPFETHGFSKKDKDVSFYSEHFASRLSANGVQVITPQQIASVKEMDKLRQLAGCPATSADCIIELGHMLGAQGVVRGTLAKVGDLFQVDVRVYNSSDGKVVVARSVSTRSNEGLVRALDLLAVEIAAQVKKGFGVAEPPPPPDGGKKTVTLTPPPPPVPVAPPPPPPPLDLRTVAWAPALGGVVAGVAGGGLLVLSQLARSDLAGGGPTYDKAVALRQRGELMGDIGTGLVIAGAAGLAVGGGLRFFGAPKSPATVKVSPTPGGATLEVKFP